MLSLLLVVAGLGVALYATSTLWTDKFIRMYIDGEIDVREEEIEVHNEPVAGQFLTPLDVTFNLPVGRVFESLLVRTQCAFTVGAANCTGLNPHGMQRVLRSARLELQKGRRSPEVYDGDVQVWNPRGVNDAAAGRTASFAGIALSREYLLDHGVAPPQTDPGLNIGVNNGEIVHEISFKDARNRLFPWRTLLNTNDLTRATLVLRYGVLETTAAGDDTDVYVTAAGSTVATTAVITLTGRAMVRCPSFPFDVKKIRTLTDFLAVAAEQQVDVGENAYYKRLMLHVTDNDVDSNARVLDVAFQEDHADDVYEKAWLDIQQEAQGRYHIAMPAGFAPIDFDPQGIGRVQNLWGRHSALLLLNVPAGAVAAQDQIHTILHEIKPHPGRNAP